MFDNININKCFSNYYPTGIYIIDSKKAEFILAHNLSGQYADQEIYSEIKNSYFSNN